MAEDQPQEAVFEEDEPEDTEDPEVLLTLNEVLQYEDKMMEDAAAVLGVLNDKACSYSDEYVKRQALYSCLTCIPEAKTDPEKRSGVCLACSYYCHDGHELIELYTKRNFRCDCGNSKFGSIDCNLLPEKDELNTENVYNQNFQGTYCICNRPYPDPEDPVADEMIQCIICEDWYHSRHLNVPLPLEPFIEMVCFNCVGEHKFLLHYGGTPIEETTDDANDKDPLADENPILSTEPPAEESAAQTSVSEEKTDLVQISGDCKKPKTVANVSTLFWPDISWRNTLCTCDICLEMYGDENVLFLLDPDDPVQIYEEKGKAKAQDIIEEQDRNLMGSIDRVQLVEALTGMNELKDELREFFRGFAEQKKVIRKEDVKEFFEEMQAKKKRKVEIPYYCR